jgi:hypothetical protein
MEWSRSAAPAMQLSPPHLMLLLYTLLLLSQQGDGRVPDHPLVAINVGGPKVITSDSIVYEADRCATAFSEQTEPSRTWASGQLVEALPDIMASQQVLYWREGSTRKEQHHAFDSVG